VRSAPRSLEHDVDLVLGARLAHCLEGLRQVVQLDHLPPRRATVSDSGEAPCQP